MIDPSRLVIGLFILGPGFSDWRISSRVSRPPWARGSPSKFRVQVLTEHSGNGGAGIDMPLRHREREQRAIPRTAPLQ